MVLAFSACGSAGNSTPSATSNDVSSTAENNTDVVASTPVKTYTLRLGHEGQGESHPYQYGAEQFAKLVSEKTNGAVTIEVYGNAALGSQKEMVERVYTGTLDMVENVFSVYEAYCPDIGSLVLPFMFDNLDHYWACMDGDLGDKITGWLSEKGFTMLTVFQNGEAGMESKYPVQVPADIQGLKFRAPSGQVADAISKKVGLNGSSLSLSELYSAFQLGTIECAAYNVPNSYNFGLYEVAPYFCELSYQIMGEPVAINSEVFENLPDEYQTALVEAAHEAAVLQRNYAQENVITWQEEMAQNGATFYKPTESELAQWKDAMDIYDQFPQWQDIVDLVKATQY